MGVFKPGERSIWKKCPKCKGKGTTALTTNSKTSPCAKCKGTGEIAIGPADPTQYFKQSKKELSLKDLVKEAEEMWCPKCKINVIPEPVQTKSKLKLICPHCGNEKLEPSIREMNTTASIGGYNAPLDVSYDTDEKGIKHNFKVREMKTFRKLTKEAEAEIDLSTKEKTLTNLLYKLSKKGELQKHLDPKYYNKNSFFKWLKDKAEEAGTYVSEKYWSDLYSRLKGNPKVDAFTIYNAAMAGSGLGLNEDKNLREYE